MAPDTAATTYTHTNPPHALLDMAGTVAVVAPGGTVLFRLTLAAAEDFADNLARQAEYGRREAKP